MYKLCKTEESTARQKELENGLMELMLEVPFEEISVSSLCKFAGIPRNTFYRYFSSREDALIGLIDHTLMDASDNSIANWSGNAHLELDDLEHFFVYWQQKQRFLDAIVKNDRSWLLIERAIRMHEQKQAQTTAAFDAANFAKEQIPYIMTYGMVSILLRWHRCGYPAPPEEMAKVAFQMFASSSIAMKDVLL